MEQYQVKKFVLGFVFKANTNDTRESSAINICKDLLDKGQYFTFMIQKLIHCKLAMILKEENHN